MEGIPTNGHIEVDPRHDQMELLANDPIAGVRLVEISRLLDLVADMRPTSPVVVEHFNRFFAN